MLETCKSENSALFICLGNICRSPIAEAVCKKVVIDMMVSNRWHIDSAAIGPWHVGNQPDHRALKTLRAHGLSTDHLCRQINSNDFRKFDYILGMDIGNIKALNNKRPEDATAKILLLASFHPNGVILDPAYLDEHAFETCYQQCLSCCSAFIKQTMNEKRNSRQTSLPHKLPYT
ncbi:low molecular weight phosphotyrosine protein phosphatase isoform X3 [Nilaparvata lugens]|uniref:low molecular weight phosphotyrosine protein phosphatase isoform X3 n=1 Tax=Nilaparvata lugens TaxID=108931 RepID=UPI000B99951D|nr:low molecular weight phosphotyrosine protein phosphatase isoform X3 [Nilaparvata lugens]